MGEVVFEKLSRSKRKGIKHWNNGGCQFMIALQIGAALVTLVTGGCAVNEWY